MFLTRRSRSAFFTASPFTRASTSGSCAGTGFAAGAVGGGVAPPVAGGVLAVPAAGAGVAPGLAAVVPDCAGAAAEAVVDAAGALRHAAPLQVTTVMRMVDRTLIKTKTSTLWRSEPMNGKPLL